MEIGVGIRTVRPRGLLGTLSLFDPVRFGPPFLLEPFLNFGGQSLYVLIVMLVLIVIA